jgi:alpha-beta hydrolase superfamily lysophospholipase
MKARRLVRWGVVPIALGVAAVAAVVLLFAIHARMTLPPLRAWHRVVLTEEFHAGRASTPRTFDEYRLLEDRLFVELRRKVVDEPTSSDGFLLSRYRPGSVPEKLALDTRYNRSYELVPPHPRGGVLLVHGLTDSPYSMRALADTFFNEDYHVVVLRLPGHGTIPASLCDVTWQDWYAAVVLGMRRAAEAAGPGRPVLAAGYSTGAALVTLYALRASEDPALPRPDRLYLISPAIGVSKLAVLTNVLAGLGSVPYFEKSKWLDVIPEYDPYKYNSFPIQAGNQIYRLTNELRSSLDAAEVHGTLGAMPKIIVFQSLVDATILASEVVSGLLERLPPAGHELVVFDVNRRDALEAMIAAGPDAALDRLSASSSLPFRLTVISNRESTTTSVAAFTRDAGSKEVRRSDLPLGWPAGVLSLGHVALPFPIDDPIYGLTPAPSEGPALPLGSFSARGEPGAMVVPFDTLSRLRSNPFFDVIRTKVRESLSPAPGQLPR